MLLTEEEIWDCKTPCIDGTCPYGIGDEPAYEDKDDSVCFLCEQRSQAKAQLKKVVEWGIEICSEHLPKWEGRVDLMGGVLSKRECPKCWQALLKDIE